MSKTIIANRREFIKAAAAVTLGAAITQGCGNVTDTPENDASDPSSAADPTDASDAADVDDPSSTPDPTNQVDTADAADTADASDTADPTGVDPICDKTSADIEGPFYRENPPHRATLVTEDEPGRPLRLQGYVYAADCETPLVGAVVDVWHADDAGAYDNASSAFRMRGQMTTNAEGFYSYDTIRPGRYLNGNTYRPEHIHYKVSYATGGPDEVGLTTQLYFEGDPHLETDPWAVPERTIALTEISSANFEGQFDIVLPVEVD